MQLNIICYDWKTTTMTNRKTRSRSNLPVLLVLFVLFYIKIKLPDHRQQQRHISIISANYFPNSTSYAPNTMVILFNAPQQFWTPSALWCYSTNYSDSLTKSAIIRQAVRPDLCEWSVYLATCSTIRRPIDFYLGITILYSQSVLVPYRPVSDQKFSVVSCFSPLFYMERWQLLIATLELYRQLGVSLQIYYIQSMLVELFDFLKVYERENIVRLEPWTGLKFSENQEIFDTDLNIQLEWRNQAAAHTDCLLFYKDAAEWLIVSDLDDVLIPKLGNTFLTEFRWLNVRNNSSVGFSYSRYNTKLTINTNFSLSSFLNDAQVSNELEEPKYVVNPARVESLWIHWPYLVSHGYEMKKVQEEENFIIHLRNFTRVDFNSKTTQMLLYPQQKNFNLLNNHMADLLPQSRIYELEKNFHEFLNSNIELANIYTQLSKITKEVYQPLIGKCYRMLYPPSIKVTICPSPMRCNLPAQPGLRCTVAKRHLVHLPINRILMAHYPLVYPGYFEINNDGCAWS